MPVPSPTMAVIEMPWLERKYEPWKPVLVTSTMPPIPLEADAPPDLVTPLTASAAASASQARRSSSDVDGVLVSSRSRSGHRHGALGELCNAVAADVVGRDHRLPPSDQHAQSDVVAFRALGFLDAPVTHFDALRNATHRHRVGGVGARAPCRLDQPLRQRAECGLVEQASGCG